jgi:proline iminopeptidase
VASMYPEIEPHDKGMLDVGGGNRLYYEVCGNDAGKPAVVLHGGPGSGCSTVGRRFFNPRRYRIVLFDQRQCGRSTPLASDPRVDLSSNTTRHLVGDIDLLRKHLGIERWLVFGGSWGSVLGLAYAEENPHAVSEMLLTAVASGRRSETDLLTRGLGLLFPEDWAKFRTGAQLSDPDEDIAAAYNRLLEHHDAAVREKAARDWCDWEIAIEPTSPQPDPRYEDPSFRMTFARIVTHYWSHGSWLKEGILLSRAHLLSGIPGLVVQGTLDLGNLSGTAWELLRAWPNSQLVLVEDAGHATRHAGLVSAIVEATDKFAEATDEFVEATDRGGADPAGP